MSEQMEFRQLISHRQERRTMPAPAAPMRRVKVWRRRRDPAAVRAAIAMFKPTGEKDNGYRKSNIETEN